MIAEQFLGRRFGTVFFKFACVIFIVRDEDYPVHIFKKGFSLRTFCWNKHCKVTKNPLPGFG